MFVDIDEKSASNTLGSLPLNLQEKCTLVVEDLSGAASQISQRLVSAGSQSRSLNAFLSRMADEWKSIEPLTPNLGSDFKFACSSLVLSQLATMPHLRFSDMAIQRYGLADRSVQGPDAENYFRSLALLSRRMATDHFDLLRKVLVTGGKAYFADTLAEATISIDPTTGQVIRTSDWRFMMDSQVTKYEIPKRFTILDTQSWLWQRIPPSISTPGDVFMVYANALEAPK